MKNYITVREAAHFLEVTPQQIYNLINQGKLTRYIRRGRIYIDQEELEEYDRMYQNGIGA